MVYRDDCLLTLTFEAGIKNKTENFTPMSAEASEHLSSSIQCKVILINVWTSQQGEEDARGSK